MSRKNAFLGLLNQKGQALLIIVLVMVVALTVGLSVASRTIINLRNSSDQASSQQALSAAEAGIERAIVTSNTSNIQGGLPGNSSYTTTIASVSGTNPFLINGGNLVPKDDAVYVWLTPYSSNPQTQWINPWTGSFTVYWGDASGSCNNAALEVAVINGPKGAPTITRYAIDPCAARTGNNNFTAATVSSPAFLVGGKSLTYKTTISISSGLLVRINPIYSNAYIATSGTSALPDQGTTITSTGTSNSSTTRKVTVFQGYPEIPAELFPYSLFSP